MESDGLCARSVGTAGDVAGGLEGVRAGGGVRSFARGCSGRTSDILSAAAPPRRVQITFPNGGAVAGVVGGRGCAALDNDAVRRLQMTVRAGGTGGRWGDGRGGGGGRVRGG